MKKTILLLTLSFITAPLLADQSMQGTNASPNERIQASYAMGMYYGRYLQQRGIDTTIIDHDALISGINDAFSNQPTLLTPAQMVQTLRDFQKNNQQVLALNQMKMQHDLAQKNLAESDSFLANNSKADGVIALPDGLQYKVITAGSGSHPAPTDTVTVNYQLTLLDGTSIQNTPPNGIPLSLGSQMIPGMREALTNMTVGSVWDVWMPPGIAYGEQARGPIPPDSALKFHVQLISTSANAPGPSSPPPSPLTSDIIAVPSAADLAKGKKPYTLTSEQVQQMQSQSQTNGSK